jgi:acyl dehydratase
MNEDLDYFEDIEIGRHYAAPQPYRVTREDIVGFASTWDWRPHHVDEQAAKKSMFQGLVACGSHVFAIWTRLSLQAQNATRAQATMAGLGSEISLTLPIRPGDEISYCGEVVGKRESKSRDNAGIVETHHELRNQDGELVFRVEGVTLVQKRASLQASP